MFIVNAAAISCPRSATAAHLSFADVEVARRVVRARGFEHRVHALYDVDVLFEEVPATAEEGARSGRHKPSLSTAGGHAVDWHLLLIAYCMPPDGSEAGDTRQALVGGARWTSLWWCECLAAAPRQWTSACGSDADAVYESSCAG